MFLGLHYTVWIVILVIVWAFAALVFTKARPSAIFFVIMALFCILPVLSFEQAFAGFASSSVLLVGVLYIVIAGLKYSGALDWMVHHLMGSPHTYVMSIVRLMLPVAFLSSVMSNTTTTALFKGVVQRWAATLHISPSKLLIPLAYAATIGGLLTIIGTPPNLVIASLYAQETGEMLHLFAPFPVAICCLLVDVLAVILLRHLLLSRVNPIDAVSEDMCDENGNVVPTQGQSKWKTYASLFIMLTMLAVSALNLKAFPLYSCALVAGILMIQCRCCTSLQALKEVDWEVLIVFAGSVCLGTAIDAVGLDEIIVHQLLALCHSNPIVIMAVLALVSGLMTELVSDTACSALFFPVALQAAETLNITPLPFLIVLMMSVSSSFCTPIATPPNLIVYNDGGYRFSDYARIGIPLKVCHLLTAIVSTWLLFPFH